MFKFLKDDTDSDISKNEGSQATSPSVNVRPALEVNVNDMHYKISDTVSCGSQTCKNSCIKYILIAQLLRSELLKGDDRIKGILDSSSDLISGVYEGGFKIWECTIDLIKYLDENEQILFNENTTVLDLGCGSGLLGLYAWSKGAFVDFQDYNSEVLDYLTIPNTILNSIDDDSLLRCRYFGGDWGEFQKLIQNNGNESESTSTSSCRKYDIILSSETIYNLDNLPKFCQLVRRCLKPDGCLLLAAKTCYFGVGGGTRAFQNLLAQQDSAMTSDVVKVIKDGVQREIIKVQLSHEKESSKT